MTPFQLDRVGRAGVRIEENTGNPVRLSVQHSEHTLHESSRVRLEEHDNS